MNQSEFFKQEGKFVAEPVIDADGLTLCWRLQCNGNYLQIVKRGNRASTRGAPTASNSVYATGVDSEENERLFGKLDTLVKLCFKNGVSGVLVKRK